MMTNYFDVLTFYKMISIFYLFFKGTIQATYTASARSQSMYEPAKELQF